MFVEKFNMGERLGRFKRRCQTSNSEAPDAVFLSLTPTNDSTEWTAHYSGSSQNIPARTSTNLSYAAVSNFQSDLPTDFWKMENGSKSVENCQNFERKERLPFEQ